MLSCVNFKDSKKEWTTATTASPHPHKLKRTESKVAALTQQSQKAIHTIIIILIMYAFNINAYVIIFLLRDNTPHNLYKIIITTIIKKLQVIIVTMLIQHQHPLQVVTLKHTTITTTMELLLIHDSHRILNLRFIMATAILTLGKNLI